MADEANEGESSNEEITIPVTAETTTVEAEFPMEAIEDVQTQEETWQQTDLNQFQQTVIALQNQQTEIQLLQQNLLGQTANLQATMEQVRAHLDSALPGLQILAALADETTDRRTRKRVLAALARRA